MVRILEAFRTQLPHFVRNTRISYAMGPTPAADGTQFFQHAQKITDAVAVV